MHRKPIYITNYFDKDITKVNNFQFSEMLLMDNPIVPLSDYDGYHIMYNRVEEKVTNSLGVENNGRIVHKYFFPNNYSQYDNFFPQAPALPIATLRQLEKKEIFGYNTNTLKTSENY